MAEKILSGILCGNDRAFNIDDAKKIIDTLGLKTIKSPANKKADIKLTIHDKFTGEDFIRGYSIKSYLGSKPTLLNASKATNFKFKVFGVDDALAEKINSINTRTKIIDRLKLIERLEFDSIGNQTFAANLSLIDSKMDRILGEMMKIFYVERISGCAELATVLEERNPLNVRAENCNEAEGGCIVVDRKAEIVLYPLQNYDDFEMYLLNNTKIETPSPNRHNFGKIYEGGAQKFIDLNL